MKDAIVKEVKHILGDRVTDAEAETIAVFAIKIIEEHNKAAALAAVETVKQTLIKNGIAGVTNKNETDKK